MKAAGTLDAHPQRAEGKDLVGTAPRAGSSQLNAGRKEAKRQRSRGSPKRKPPTLGSQATSRDQKEADKAAEGRREGRGHRDLGRGMPLPPEESLQADGLQPERK